MNIRNVGAHLTGLCTAHHNAATTNSHQQAPRNLDLEAGNQT